MKKMNNFPIIATRYDHVNQFINDLAPIVCNEWIKRVKNNEHTTLPSVCLAQAGIESGYNINATTLFGIKGDDVQLDTTEYINGEYVNVTDGFKMFESIAASVQGYYGLMQWDNYADATTPYANTYLEQVTGLTNDNGYKYATSPTYAQNVISIIENFGLTAFDDWCKDYLENEIFGNDEPSTDEVVEMDYNAGDHVRVVTDEANCVYDTNGTYCRCWYDEYEVIDVNDDGVCLGINGVVFARIPLGSVRKVG